ncbi:hypothetical protein ACPVTF_02770 [Geobacillus icigianus]|uniref:hypothetical protein n=1 Tax=Geobacillus TaxID=129337 RepID=UPI00128FED85|nr:MULTISPECIES: hypothetical protein [Geobacillus]
MHCRMNPLHPREPKSSNSSIKGTGKAKFSTNNLPKDPEELINKGWKDVTPEGMATSSRELIDSEIGMKVRFDPRKLYICSLKNEHLASPATSFLSRGLRIFGRNDTALRVYRITER